MSAAFKAQFERSTSSPLAEVTAPKVVLDGATVLDKYLAGEAASAMTGAEFYAMVGHIKRQHGQKGDSLELELMKIPRQKDKKIRLIDWCTQNLGRKDGQEATPAANIPVVENLPPAGTPSRPVADSKMELPGISRLDLSGALGCVKES